MAFVGFTLLALHLQVAVAKKKVHIGKEEKTDVSS